ncbi:MAG: helix-turn-helix transcriptional regulator [Clostridia bacterium]|nr:helix-turn-helix transcriptional regulator [Clostridia bacterium]
MDQIKIGLFLKQLRKEKNLTQEDLAERLNVSNRTVSRWETGSNMPDIGMLVTIAEFYSVSIPEIISGERKSETMNQETKDTAIAMAQYSQNEAKTGKQRLTGSLLLAFGAFIIISALTVFPGDSSWSANYSVLGSAVALIGIAIMLRSVIAKRGLRLLTVAGCAVFLLATFCITDYVAVAHFGQVPRFRCRTVYDSRNPDQVVYETPFFTVVQRNPGTEHEQVEIVK